MRLLKRLKAKLLGQKPLEEDQILQIYMDAAKHINPPPLFSKDFARVIEATHGIVGKYEVVPVDYGE